MRATSLALPLVLLAAGVLALSCQTDLTLPSGATSGSSSPTPSGAPDAPTPSTPTPTPFFGDGLEGPLTPAAIKVVNICQFVAAASGHQLVFTAGFPATIRSNALFLVLQLQDSFVVPSNGAVAVANLVESSSLGQAGAWALVRSSAAASGATELVLVDALPADFGTTASQGIYAEACLTPQYTQVTVPVGSQLISSPFVPGTSAGGVVAFLASSLTEITGIVTVDSSGEPGGLANTAAGGDPDTELMLLNSATYPFRGGNADGRGVATFASGRGRVANGGGGADPLLAGGGGGGSGGTGGSGGNGCGSDGAGGVPGVDLGYGADARGGRLFFGGGGGGGGGGGVSPAPNGGAGGGLVFIGTRQLLGGGTIRADGGVGLSDSSGSIQENGCDVGGGGGGGAGGTILVWANTAAGATIRFSATGGAGGNAPVTDGNGGGGGGGRLLLTPNLVVDTQSALAPGAGGENGNSGGVLAQPGVRVTPLPPALGGG